MKPITINHLFFLIICSTLTPQLTWSAEALQLRKAQIWSCRAVSSLLLVRGEGHQQQHIERMHQDLANARTQLQRANQSGNKVIQQRLNTLTKLLNQGIEAGPEEDSLPWRYPQWLAQALSELLLAIENTLPEQSPHMERVALEFLTVQYLSNSYIGTYEPSREHPDLYIGQDEVILVPIIDQYMQAAELASKDMARWQFIRKALADLNSRSSTWASVSGKPFVPLMVDYHVRGLAMLQ